MAKTIGKVILKISVAKDDANEFRAFEAMTKPDVEFLSRDNIKTSYEGPSSQIAYRVIDIKSPDEERTRIKNRYDCLLPRPTLEYCITDWDIQNRLLGSKEITDREVENLRDIVEKYALDKIIQVAHPVIF